MAKRYLRNNGSEFLWNGRSKLRVGLVQHITTDKHPGRIIKIFAIQEVVSSDMNNPIAPGMMLAISFPEDKANTHKYEWQRGEPFQVANVKIDFKK